MGKRGDTLKLLASPDRTQWPKACHKNGPNAILLINTFD
jgi:hypothetical protein